MLKIKDLIAKVAKGEELTPEEEEVVTAADDAQDNAEEDKKLEELAVKLIAKMDGKKEIIIDEKAITKEKIEKMGEEEVKKEFFKAAVLNDRVAMTALSTGSGSEGGFLIPAAVNNELLNYLKEDSVIRANASIQPNCPQGFPITQFTSLPTSYFVGELVSKTTSQPAFGQQTLTPYTVVCTVVLSNKLKKYAEVGGDVSASVIDAMRASLGIKEEEVYAAGDGNGKPTGLEEYYAAYPSARKVTGGLLIDRIVKADTRLKPAYRANAKWYMPTSQLEAIRSLKKSDNTLLFQDDATGAFVGRIMGKPVLTNDNLTNIWYGDMRGYIIGQGSDIAIDQSNDATIVEGQTTIHTFQQNAFALRAEMDIDGELANTLALIAVEAGAVDGSNS